MERDSSLYGHLWLWPIILVPVCGINVVKSTHCYDDCVRETSLSMYYMSPGLIFAIWTGLRAARMGVNNHP